MSKERFITAHEKLIEEYLNDHPDAQWLEAYERTADATYKRMLEDFDAMIDAARDTWKYR